MIELSSDQRSVYDAMLEWVRLRYSNLLTVGGYAGTGKTTLAAQLAKQLQTQRKIAFCALSGRAASVMGAKLREAGFAFGDRHSCSTIHRLIYKPEMDEDTGEVISWSRKEKLGCDLIVMDEASMVSSYIYNDVSQYGVPILAIGDHGQLPPIEGNFSLMEAPHLRLEKIHRQAEGNPIIQLSAAVRGGESVEPWHADGNHITWHDKRDWRGCLALTYQDPSKALDRAVLCYTNRVRTQFNEATRKIMGYGPDPQEGDIVICVKNRNEEMIFNGYRGVMRSAKMLKHHVKGSVDFPTESISYGGKMFRYQFNRARTFRSYDEMEEAGFNARSWEAAGALFDYGYALTVHKAQGSQFSHVVLCKERKPPKVDEESYQRWLYTAVTRAADTLTVLG